jgi:hypothetical protein
MAEVEIVLYPDGTILVPRGSVSQNEFYLEFLKDLLDDDELESISGFFAAGNESEMIFGERFCG